MSRAILAIRPRALGDVVLTTPALRALKRGHPEASLEVVTEPAYAPLLGPANGVDRVWPCDRGWGSTARLVLALRRRRFEWAVDFFGNPRTALITAACGARRTAGYALRGRSGYGVRVPRGVPLSGGRLEYAAASHLRLARAAGGVDCGLEARIEIPPGARDEAARLLASIGIAGSDGAIGLVAAGMWATKTWPLSHAGVLARGLMADGRRVLLLAGPGQERVTATIRRLAPGVLVLPPCDVPTLAAVIAGLAAVVGIDSGPRHLAAALGVPTFAWFGPTHPDNWTPPGERHGVWWAEVPCRGCNRTACPHWICMPGLAAERAHALVLDHLRRSTSGPRVAAAGT